MDKPLSKIERRKATDTKILDAAVIEFAANGYTRATLSSIAKRAGVTQGLVSQNFGDKKSLFLTLVQNKMKEYLLECDISDEMPDAVIDVVHLFRKIAADNLDDLRFMHMLNTSPDIPEEYYAWMREAVVTSKLYRALEAAQIRHEIPAGDIVSQIRLFYAGSVFNILTYTKNNVTLPDDDFYLSLLRYEKPAFDISKNKNCISEESRLLLSVQKWLYPLCILSNLTQNTYKIIEYDYFPTKKASRSGTYDELIAAGVSTIPDAEQQKEFLRLFSRENLLEAYKHNEGERFLFHQQVSDDGSIHWVKTKCGLLPSENGDVLLLSFARIIDGDIEWLKAHTENENAALPAVDSRYCAVEQAVINSLSRDYSLICCIDAETGNDTVFRYDSSVAKDFDEWSSISNFDDRLRCLCNNCVHSEDREHFLAASSREKVLEELKTASPYYVDYRVITYTGDLQYWRIKFVLVEERNRIIAAFRNADEDIRREINERAELKRNLDIIEVLASDYSSVYYIDLLTENLTPYSMNKETEAAFSRVIHGDIRYSQAFQFYVNHVVYRQDKERMLAAGSIENIKNELKNKKSFVTTYRMGSAEDSRFCEMKFVKINGENDAPTAVVLGFSTKDEEIALRYVDDKLCREYSSIYLIDIDAGLYRNVRPSTLHPSTLSGFETFSRGGYSEAILVYSMIVSPEYRQMWENIARIGFIRDYFAAEDRRELIYRIEKEGNPWRRAVFQIVSRRNGVPTLMLLTFMEIDREMANTLALSARISEQNKLLEEQQRSLAKALNLAQASNRAKTTFLFNMSHDVRTPMNAILGFTDLARNHIDDTKRVADCLDKISAAGDSLLSLINDVLSMSRIEAGVVTIQEAEIDLHTCVEQLATIVQESAKNKNIRFSYSCSVEHSRVFADVNHLNQVLLNILSNSVTYTPDGGSVVWTVTEEESGKADCSTFTFIIEDTGVGMSKEFLHHIFEEFSRERNSTLSGVQGTGLGMSIVKKLVDLMNGKISIASELGKGTTVTLSFDFHYAGEIALSPAAPDAATKNIVGNRVLLVEDNELNREIAQEILADAGLIVESAENGSVAVDKVRAAGEGYYDAVLMDIQMPVMNGYDAARTIRAYPAFRHLPIIALSANAFEEDRRLSLDAGMNAHLAKPINVRELLMVLSDVMNNPDKRD